MRSAEYIADFGMDTITLAGPLAAKLRAIKEAGFSQVMMAARDIVGHADGWQAAVAEVKASGLRVTGFQVLRDFEGLSGHLHDYKVDIARSMIEMCAALRSPILLACSSTSRHAAADDDAIARDLRKLALLAIPLGIRIAFKGMPWSRTVRDFRAAGDVVFRTACPNLGLSIDAFDVLAAGAALEDLDAIDPEQIFLVQLSDYMWQEMRSPEEQTTTATHFRVFPGEGAHSEGLARFVTRLDALGYLGDYSFDVYNDDYLQVPPEDVAGRARQAADWLGETVLRRALPIPDMARLRPPRTSE
jgi:sugar phosphate isomerase/epimerase